MALMIEMLLSALTGHGHPSLADASRAAGSNDPWPVKATDAPFGPPSPHQMGQGGKLSSLAEKSIRGMRSKMISCPPVAQNRRPLAPCWSRGTSSLCSSISTNRPYFRNRLGALPEIGKEHLI